MSRRSCGRRFASSVRGSFVGPGGTPGSATAIRTCSAGSSSAPWAERLFERIDALTRSEVTSELERITQLYAMGHWEKDRYVQERARLEEDRRQLEDQAQPQRALQLEGVLDGWRSGDPVVRRALAAALFEELYVEHGEIVGWKARRAGGRGRAADGRGRITGRRAVRVTLDVPLLDAGRHLVAQIRDRLVQLADRTSQPFSDLRICRGAGERLQIEDDAEERVDGVGQELLSNPLPLCEHGTHDRVLERAIS
jgi:hypothetical protein